MYFFDDWKPGEWIALIALFVSGLTLLLGFIAYKRLLVQEAKKSQLKLVLELINLFSKYYFTLTLHEDEITAPFSLTLFQVANNGMEGDCLNYPVYIIEGTKFDFFNSFDLFNPLIPKDIADKLMMFNEQSQLVPMIELPKKYFNIGEPFLPGISIMVRKRMKFNGDYSSLVKSCEEIRNAFIKWLKRHGVKDFNTLVFSANFWKESS